VTTAFSFRRASAQDAEAIAALVQERFEGYRAFAPPGWRPPLDAGELGPYRERIEQPNAWLLLAEHEGELAGHVAFIPATTARQPVADPELAHLWQLFVRPRFWGSGLAARLLAAAMDEATARGFAEMRLFTPAGQARARRFYEREGWTPGEPFEDSEFGMALVEYRRRLGDRVLADAR
jgi:GNAT superfamily N-acetyltransferase